MGGGYEWDGFLAVCGYIFSNASKKYYFVGNFLNLIVMRFWALFYLSIICVFTNCSGQTRASDPAENKLTFIILGNDSIICYTGTSNHIQNIKRGLVSDTAFMNGMFRKISGKGATPVFKAS